jgi:glyoxylase-like metal-dependent hydrolase (beta-lactamase superfamily II)
VNVTAIPVAVEARVPGGATNACVVGDDPALLIDPAGPDGRLDAAVAGREVAHVAVTHAHPDHVGGVARYAERTGATVWARRGRAEHFERATGRTPDRTFLPGDALPLGDGKAVTVLDAPGHAADHVAFDADGRVVCGDLAVAEGSVAVAAPEGDVRAYLTSLRRLHATDPDALVPGHGPRIDDPRATLARLLAHRLERERRVLAVVESGARDVDAVVDGAYDRDLSGVRDLARATTIAHLEKLAVEGRVRWLPDEGRVEPATVP